MYMLYHFKIMFVSIDLGRFVILNWSHNFSAKILCTIGYTYVLVSTYFSSFLSYLLASPFLLALLLLCQSLSLSLTLSTSRTYPHTLPRFTFAINSTLVLFIPPLGPVLAPNIKQTSFRKMWKLKCKKWNVLKTAEMVRTRKVKWHFWSALCCSFWRGSPPPSPCSRCPLTNPPVAFRLSMDSRDFCSGNLVENILHWLAL